MKKRSWLGLLFVMPATIIMGILVFYPIVSTFLYSFQQYNLREIENRKFVGIDNYLQIIGSKEFWAACLNTAIIMVIVVAVGLMLSLILALLLNKKVRLNGFLTAVAILPWALPPIVNGQLWKFIFATGYGLVNKLFIALNWADGPMQILGSRFSTLMVLGIVVSWRLIPFCSIAMLANLQSIPEEIYQAAEIDGANQANKFTEITLPHLVPTILVVLIYLSMNSIFTFDEAIALVGNRAISETLLIHNYTQTFNYFNFGYGSAVTYAIMLIAGILGYFHIKTLGEKGDKRNE